MNTQSRNLSIDNIEFNVEDIARSKTFYGTVFGWKFVDYGLAYSEFHDGRLTGGFTTGEPVRPGGPLIIIYGDNLGDIQRKLVDAGASISREIFSFPGGRRFHFIDLDGYELAVWCADQI